MYITYDDDVNRAMQFFYKREREKEREREDGGGTSHMTVFLAYLFQHIATASITNRYFLLKSLSDHRQTGRQVGRQTNRHKREAPIERIHTVPVDTYTYINRYITARFSHVVK